MSDGKNLGVSILHTFDYNISETTLRAHGVPAFNIYRKDHSDGTYTHKPGEIKAYAHKVGP